MATPCCFRIRPWQTYCLKEEQRERAAAKVSVSGVGLSAEVFFNDLVVGGLFVLSSRRESPLSVSLTQSEHRKAWDVAAASTPAARAVVMRRGCAHL